MELSNAIDQVAATRSELSKRNDVLDELVALAVRRLVSEPFEVLAKGLNPSRFDSWSKGARSEVARQYGSSSDLMAEVLRRAVVPGRGNLAGTLAVDGEVIAAGESYQTTARAFANAFYDNLATDDGFRVQIIAWVAAPNRSSLSDELNELYESMEERICLGIEATISASKRQLKPGLTLEEQAGMLLASTEGAVVQGMVRGHDFARARFAEYAVFLLENATEPME
jgi:hypothetical protein